MKVLIGEKNRATRTMLKNTMEVLDHEVKSCETEEEVMKALKSDETYDTLFLSWTLPNEGGLDFIEGIREKYGKKLYIILMVPDKKRIEGNLIKALRSGADDFLVKPLSKDLIRSRMQKIKTSVEIEAEGLSTEPLEDLREEHELLRRWANVLEVIHYRIGEEVPEKILDWIGSASHTLDQKVHHKKEKHYLISFLENAMKEQGEVPDSKLFSRSSLKQVEEEHDKLEEMVKRIQKSVDEGYKEEKINAGEMREMLIEYKELLRSHLDREERFLFPLSAKYMDEDTSKELMNKFEKVEEEAGKDKIEKFKKQMSRVEEKLYLK
ncbi:MAG: hemerythrin domain-containing protein [Candidatus Thermoplasmatota archaeon]|nr:hemerythrin domain-containing protein [Candidatus Thermoplasmatota archaeon]